MSRPSSASDAHHPQQPCLDLHDCDYEPIDSPGSNFDGNPMGFPSYDKRAETTVQGGGQGAASVTASYQPSDSQSLHHDRQHQAALPAASLSPPPPPQRAMQGQLPPNGMIPASIAVFLPPAAVLPPALLPPPSAQG